MLSSEVNEIKFCCPVKAYLAKAVKEAGNRDYIATSASVPFCSLKQ